MSKADCVSQLESNMDTKGLCQGNLCQEALSSIPKHCRQTSLSSDFTVQEQLGFKFWNNSKPICIRYLIAFAWFCTRLLIFLPFILKAATECPDFKSKVKQNKSHKFPSKEQMLPMVTETLITTSDYFSIKMCIRYSVPSPEAAFSSTTITKYGGSSMTD